MDGGLRGWRGGATLWDQHPAPMRTILSLLLIVTLLVLGLGTCLLIWYLSATAEFSRKAPAAAPAPASQGAR